MIYYMLVYLFVAGVILELMMKVDRDLYREDTKFCSFVLFMMGPFGWMLWAWFFLSSIKTNSSQTVD